MLPSISGTKYWKDFDISDDPTLYEYLKDFVYTLGGNYQLNDEFPEYGDTIRKYLIKDTEKYQKYYSGKWLK